MKRGETMSDPQATDAGPWIDLLRESARWRLLGLLFEEPNDAWRDEVPRLAAEADDETLAATAWQALGEAESGLYHSTFGPGGPACPREVRHGTTLSPGGLLAELEDYYRAFGYRPTCPEAPDHIAVEAGFVAFLRLKQAYALANGLGAQAEIAAAAADRFLSEHLASMAAPLAQSLRLSGIAYLATAAEAMCSCVGSPTSRT
jgi:nitrate reductase assembly molybdenum cofactor insertion protein NarJ